MYEDLTAGAEMPPEELQAAVGPPTPEPPPFREIEQFYTDSRSALSQRDALVDEMRQRFHCTYKGPAYDREYGKPVAVPLFQEATLEQCAILERAKLNIRVLAQGIEDTPESRAALERIRKWMYGVLHTNNVMRAVNLRHLLHLSQVIEGAAVMRITWQYDSPLNPVIDVFPWRRCYMPRPVAGIPGAIAVATEMAISEIEAIWGREVPGVGKLGFAEKRRQTVEQVDVWLLHEGMVWNGVYAARGERILGAMKDMTPMPDYPTVPFVVIPYMETQTDEPERIMVSPLWAYRDIVDNVEDIIGAMRFITDIALNLPMVHRRSLAVGGQTATARFGPLQIVPINEGEELTFPQMPIQPQPQGMLQLLMLLSSRLRLPPASGQYLSGAGASVQAAIGREVLSIAADSAALGIAQALRICLELGRRHGQNLTLNVLPPKESPWPSAMEAAADVMLGLTAEEIPPDVIVDCDLEITLPGDDMRRAQLATQMKAAGVFSRFDILRAVMPDEAMEAYQRALEEEMLPMATTAIMMEELKRAGYNPAGALVGAAKPQPGTPSPPGGVAPAPQVGGQEIPIEEGLEYGPTEFTVGRPG